MIYYSRLHPAVLKTDIYFAKTKKGICFISFNKSENDFLKQIAKNHDDEIIFAPKMLHKESGQIKRYLEGKRKKFSLRIDINGSDFQIKVWHAISKVPYGKTVSYSKLAKNVKESQAFRAVANACGKNPLPIIIPCHRIVAKDGSLGGYTGGLEIKRNLLRIENSN
jgi:O-6-methylguanine DNA methyltransferase